MVFSSATWKIVFSVIQTSGYKVAETATNCIMPHLKHLHETNKTVVQIVKLRRVDLLSL